VKQKMAFINISLVSSTAEFSIQQSTEIEKSSGRKGSFI